jgi:hypothetical protein
MTINEFSPPSDERDLVELTQLLRFSQLGSSRTPVDQHIAKTWSRTPVVLHPWAYFLQCQGLDSQIVRHCTALVTACAPRHFRSGGQSAGGRGSAGLRLPLPRCRPRGNRLY